MRGRGGSGSATRTTPRRSPPTLTLTTGAVATSGAYERGEHILDPYTGEPPRGVLSASPSSGRDLAAADAYATAAFAMGEAGPRWTAGLRGYEAMTVLSGDRVLTTPGLRRAHGSVTDGGGPSRSSIGSLSSPRKSPWASCWRHAKKCRRPPCSSTRPA